MKQDKFLEFGVHIGTLRRKAVMEPFVYKIRSDGLAVLDVQKVDERLALVGKFLARYEPERTLVVAARDYAQPSAKKFAKLIRANCIVGRFLPGSLTNPSFRKFRECDVLMVSDPLVDKQAVTEANQLGIPVLAFCDTNNTKEKVDLLVPGNNKGKKSLAFLYWALTTYVLRERGELQKHLDIDIPPEEF